MERGQRLGARVVIRRALELVAVERLLGVLLDRFEQRAAVAALGHANRHLAAAHQREELLVEREVLGLGTQQHLARDVVRSGVAVDLFEDGGGERGRVEVLHLVDHDALAPHHAPTADVEDLH